MLLGGGLCGSSVYFPCGKGSFIRAGVLSALFLNSWHPTPGLEQLKTSKYEWLPGHEIRTNKSGVKLSGHTQRTPTPHPSPPDPPKPGHLRSMVRVSVRPRTLCRRLSSLCGSSFRNRTASTSMRRMARILFCKVGNSPSDQEQRVSRRSKG